ncbi:MAG: hypothetical protein QMD77_00545 [Patescibacteria group bacterium]|nr:hypothetical protein [Patescibacteria group bacterium]
MLFLTYIRIIYHIAFQVNRSVFREYVSEFRIAITKSGPGLIAARRNPP